MNKFKELSKINRRLAEIARKSPELRGEVIALMSFTIKLMIGVLMEEK